MFAFIFKRSVIQYVRYGILSTVYSANRRVYSTLICLKEPECCTLSSSGFLHFDEGIFCMTTNIFSYDESKKVALLWSLIVKASSVSNQFPLWVKALKYVYFQNM